MSTPLPFAPMLSIPVLPKGPKPIDLDNLTMVDGVDAFGLLFAMYAAQTPMVSPSNPTLGEATVNPSGTLISTGDPAGADATEKQSTQSQLTMLPPDPLGLIARVDQMAGRDATPDVTAEHSAQTTNSGVTTRSLIESMRLMPEATTMSLNGPRPLNAFPSERVVHDHEQSHATPTVTIEHDANVTSHVILRVAVAEPDRWSSLARNLNIQHIDVTTNYPQPGATLQNTADKTGISSVPTSQAAQLVPTPTLMIEQVAAENRMALMRSRRVSNERESAIPFTKTEPAKQSSIVTRSSFTLEMIPGDRPAADNLVPSNQAISADPNRTTATELSENVPQINDTPDPLTESAPQGTAKAEVSRDIAGTAGNATVMGFDSKEPDSQLPHVRFTLPEQLPVPNNGRSHTVTINLEPEHLGPARLHLSSHNDVVSARLTVDTPEAKAVVDGSLDRLVEQLHKAGVRVQQVDVQVRGDLLPGHSQHQQTSWRRGFAGRSRALSPLAAAESSVARPLSMLLTPQVMTAGQLNLYA